MPPTRKGSPGLELASLQASVLSAFNQPYAYSNPSHRVPKKRKLERRKPPSTNTSSVASLCDDLCCVSTDEGASHLSSLKQNLKSRKYSPTQLAAQLFVCDQVDTGPPLCAAVDVLRERLIHLKDVSPAMMIERAILELRSPDTCSCRGRKNGLQALIRFLVEESRSSERDCFLQQFLAVLFHTGDASLAAQRKDRFRLAEHTLCVLREHVHERDEDMLSLQEWVRQASLPTRAAAESIDTMPLDIWTPELSGLGTGANPWEYLTHGKEEERALVSLFKVVSPVTASRVYLECVHSVLHHTKASARIPPRGRGCWSRVVILGRRVLDTTFFADADPELRFGIQSSLNGILTSAVSFNAYHDIAVLVCLIRCLLISPGSSGEKSFSSKGVKEYEKWLTGFASRGHGTALVTLLKTMSELVPLEPLQMLRVNHRVLSLKRDHARLAADYLVSVRGRISDLKPANSELFSTAKHRDSEDASMESSASTADDVIQFVLEFSKSKRIPSPLVRKMNFHRHFFRTRILKSILDPNLGGKFNERRFNGQLVNAISFDEYRIEMIKELAFNRKDKAISVTEANEAIVAIFAAKRRAAASENHKCAKEPVAALNITDSSSTLEICRAILDESHARSDASVAFRDTKRAPILRSIDILVKKINDTWTPQRRATEKSEAAAELLHGMVNAIAEACKQTWPSISADMFECTTDSALRSYTEWWVSHGAGLLQAVQQLIDSSAGRELQKLLQYQLIGVLCARDSSLPEESMVALSMLSTCVAKVGGTAALMDTLMMSQRTTGVSCGDFLSCLISCLPLGRPDVVTSSVAFVIHCACLHITHSEMTTLSLIPNTTTGIHAAESRQSKGSVPTPRAYLAMLDLLRWIVGHPWRLSTSPTGRLTRSSLNTPRTDFSAIAFTARFLVSPRVLVPHDFTIDEYASIEERCGWGRVASVYEELRRREISGAHPTRLLCQLALSLARRDSSGWPSVAWMERGLTRYAEEKSLHCTAEVSPHMGSCDASQFLERSVSADHAVVGLRLLDSFARMRLCYFHGCSGTDIERHLTTFLVPWYWPFPSNLANYLWDCMSRRCLAWESEHCGIKENVLVLCSLSLYCSICSDMVKESEERLAQSFAAGRHTDDMICMISELRKAMEEASAYDSGMDGDIRTQVVTRTVSRSLLPANLTKAFGSCLVLGLAKKCQLMERDARTERIRAWICEVGTVVDEANISDFLTTAIGVALFLPFTRFVEEYERKDLVLEITNEILQELFERHLRRLAEGRVPFQWTTRTLHGVPVLFEDIRNSIGMWMGAGSGSSDTNESLRLTCLPIDVCMARLFERMGCLGEESFRYLVSSIGRDGILQCLIPNVLSICRRLCSHEMGVAGSKLSKLTRDLLFEHKDALAKEMIAVAIKILGAARAVLDSFGDAATSRAVAGYQEFREEVMSGVKAKHVNMN